MAYEKLSDVQFEALVENYERVHGPNARGVALHTEFVRMVTALFDEARPKGKRFQLFIEWGDKSGGASFQIWEDVNYGTPARKAPNELWKGHAESLPRDAAPDDVREMMEDAFKDAAKWPLRGE